jgi:hypothetical protein
MVVITIIAVLVALAAGAVWRVISNVPKTKTRTEISQFEVSVAATKKELNDVAYLPSRLKLSERGSYPLRNTAGTLDNISVSFLQKAFGKNINLTDQSATLTVGSSPTAGSWLDWNGDGVVAADTTLFGDQVLVFYLGGIPVPSSLGGPGTLGFSTNPQNPTAAGGTRKGPYFEFSASRLVMQSNGFFQYLDGFTPGTPYIYFSSNKSGNDYNQTGDSPSFAVNPYYEGSSATPRYMKPTTFQIISAGPDGFFGPGGLWSSTTGSTAAGAADDLANFSRYPLGSPVN